MQIENNQHALQLARFFSFILIAGFFLLISHPAYHGGLFQSHDDVQVARIQAMATELKSGQFPVRYVDEFSNGGGYFLFNFYSPLVYYLGAVIHLFGLEAVAVTKIINLGFLAVGTIGTFILLKSKTSLSTSTLGTVMFLTSPYVFHDFFHRGALAEASAMMLVPWVLWSFIKISESSRKIFFLTGAVSFALVTLTHTLTAAMLGGVLVFLSLTTTNNKQLKNFYFAILTAIALVAFYFLPALLENKYTIYNQVDFVQNGYKDQFISLSNHLGSQEIITEKKPFLGLSLTLSISISLALALIKQKMPNRKLLLVLLFITVFGIFITSPHSAILWEKITYLRFIQFPYRALTFIVFSLVLAFALCLEVLPKKTRLVVAGLCLLSSLLYLPYYKAIGYQHVGQYQAEGPCRTTAWNNEHLPVWAEECMPLEMSRQYISYNTKSEAKPLIRNVDMNNNGRRLSFVVNHPSGSLIVHKHYFPSWQAKINDQKIKIYPSTQYGLITIDITDEMLDQKIIVELKKTKVQLLSEVISLLAISIFIIYCVKHKHEIFSH